jgi:hypothetical protein
VVFTGPSVVRSCAADPEDEPQWLARSLKPAFSVASGCLWLPYARLRSDPTVPVLGASCWASWSGSLEATSTWA